MTTQTHFTVSAPAIAIGLQDDEIPEVIESCPGNGTRYVLILTPVPNSDADRVLGSAHGAVLVSLWPGDRSSACAVFRRNAGYLAPSYVAEKLRVNVDDAEALAVILGEALDRPHPGSANEQNYGPDGSGGW